MKISADQVNLLIRQLSVVVVDDNSFMRKIVRGLLSTIGVKEITEASDGIAALELIRETKPDLLILDWEMPLLNGPELVQIIRSPGVFPYPELPIIMLTAHGDRWRVIEAARLGINEFACKPISAKVLRDRMISIMLKPRKMVRIGDYYVPEPRPNRPDATSDLNLKCR